ncbi:MAG: histidine kinase [Desulfobacterales bacterium]|nr:histidine kinase [Desulfobacterales bacterium]
MFTENLKLEIATICIVHMVAIVLSVACLTLFYIKTRREDHAANAFMVMQGAMIFWMIFKILKTVAPEIHSRWIFILGYYACTCILEVAFIEFGYAYAKGRQLSWNIRKIFYGVAALQFSWILTNPLHFQFYRHYDFWGDSFGPLFYLHMLLEYGFITAGFLFCRQRFKAEFSGKNKIVTHIISTAIIVPLVLNILFITKVIHRFTIVANIPVVFDITPIVFTWSTLLFMYATFNHDFFSPTPVMRHEITHHLNLALALFNNKFNVGYANLAFQEMSTTGTTVDKIMAGLRAQPPKRESITREEVVGEETFLVHCKPVKKLTGRQYLVSIKNISLYKNIQADIQRKTTAVARENQALEETIERLKDLSRKSARSYVARELHDIIGHSLVTAVKLLEVARIYARTDPAQSRSALGNAGKALDRGLSGIATIPLSAPGPAPRTGDELKRNILSLMAPMEETGLDVSLNFQGVIYVLEHAVFQVLERTCTELMTNCMKHAQATRLFFALKIKETEITLLAVDNGRGSSNETRMGSGLKGMGERISALQGTLLVTPSPRDGFMVRIAIPRGQAA